MGQNDEIKRFFDGCAESWDSRCSYSPEKIAAVVTLAGIAPGSRVADVACGTGVLFREMLSRGPAEVTGIDLSEKMIAGARAKYSDPRLRLLAADLFDVRETGFDVAVLFNAYPHFPDRRRLAGQLSGMLKTGGRFLVAHCEGRDCINRCHSGEAGRISRVLRPAAEEAAVFSEYFRIDMTADTPEIYFFSGTKRPQVPPPRPEGALQNKFAAANRADQ